MAVESAHPEYRFHEADRMIVEGRIVEAAQALHDLVRDFPDYGRAYNHLGYIYETRFRDQQTAEEFYRQGIAHSPDYPAVYLNYAILLASQQRWADLEPLLDQALACPGINLSKIEHERGMMFEAQGRYTEAMHAYEHAIQCSFVDADISLFTRSVRRLEAKMLFFDTRTEAPAPTDPGDSAENLN